MEDIHRQQDTVNDSVDMGMLGRPKEIVTGSMRYLAIRLSWRRTSSDIHMYHSPSRRSTPANVLPLNDKSTVRLGRVVHVTTTRMISAVIRHVREIIMTDRADG